MIGILIVDDHAAFRQPLAFVLDREPDLVVVGQAGSLAEARGQLALPDVALIDLDLPDGNGADLIREFRVARPEGRSLVLTASQRQQEFAGAAAAGAVALLHKSLPLAAIVDAIRRAHAGESIMSAREVRGYILMAARQRDERRAARALHATLTRREQELLQALADGLSDKATAQRLGIGIETVRTHLGNVLRKLGVSSRLQALIFAVRHGIVPIEGAQATPVDEGQELRESDV